MTTAGKELSLPAFLILAVVYGVIASDFHILL